MIKKTRLFLAAAGLLLASAVSAADGANSSEKRSASHSLLVSAGPAWVTSKVYTPSGKYSWRTGFAYSAEYNCVFRNYMGFGLTFAQDNTSYPEGTLRQTYVGPSFVMAGMLSPHWRGKLDLGIGYASCHGDAFDTKHGLGMKSTLGMEYMVSPSFGIGAEILSLSTYFGEADDNEKEFYESEGISTLGITVGVRYHF